MTKLAHPAATWSVFAATARGALHARTGRPNQDAHRVTTGTDGAIVLAAADGHGDPRCVRADVGARLAVDVATAWATMLVDHNRAPGALGDAAASFGDTAVTIATRWRAAVDDHVRRRPFDGPERARLGDGEPPYGAYGTTLLLAVADRTSVLVAQVGDGDVLLVDSGGSVRRPIEADPDLVGGATNSLAADEHAVVARSSLEPVDDRLRLVVLATDGYGNSFSVPAWDHAVGEDYVRLLDERGATWMAEQLPTWVAASADAAGDDVTVVVGARSGGT